MQKAVLWIFGLITLGFGVWSLLQPAAVAAAVQIGLPTPASTTEFRAFYGGLEIGVALFWIIATRREALIPGALLSMFLVWAGVAVTRGAGMLIDGSESPVMWFAFGLECVAAIAAWLAMQKSSDTADSTE
ncbi:MAG: DUF4345 domain-containing protein [Pseudomonadota bacterium]